MHLANASGPGVRESVPVCKCQLAGYHSNPSRVLHWAAVHRGAENPLLTSGLLLCTLDPGRHIMALGLGFGILQKGK